MPARRHSVQLTMNKASASPKPARKLRRASGKKVKTGCQNCKDRRVKCDEDRPECYNCVKSGRNCGGFPASKRSGDIVLAIAPRPPVNDKWQAERPNSVSSGSSSSSDVALLVVPPLAPRTTTGVLVSTTTKTKKNTDNIAAKATRVSSPTIWKPSTIWFNAEEARYFQVFRTRTASELSGFFDSEFWTRSVLQESHGQASVRHAVVALGALYKTLEKASESPPTSPTSNMSIDTAPNHYQFALQQYAKAITRMRESLQNNETRSHRTVLISIVLFTCFESFTGDHCAAIQQIQAGLTLLHKRQERSRQRFMAQEEDVVEDELVQIFTRLAIQAKSYDMAFHFPFPYIIRLSPPSNIHDSTAPTSPSSPGAASTASLDSDMPEVFSSLHEARQALDSLTERIMRFNELLSSNHQGPDNILPRSVLALGHGFGMQLQHWHSAFDPLLEGRRRPGVSNTERAGINVLKMIHIMTNVLFLMASSTSEMDFDKFTRDFKEITELAKEVVVDEELTLAQLKCGDRAHCKHVHWSSGEGATEDEPYSHIKASFALDIGIIAPLFVVATKCRNRKLRREAIRMLTSSPRREGMWDSLLCGRAAQWTMEVEEEGLSEWDGPFGRSALQTPGEGKRVMVKEILFNLQKREATLKCGTRGKRDGEYDERARETYVWW